MNYLKSNDRAGYIYLLSNASMPDIVKIGRTFRDPDTRMEELSSATGVPTPFVLIYKAYFDDCVKAESTIHLLLSEQGYRVSQNREFFTVPIPEAIDIIHEYLNNISHNDKNKVPVIVTTKYNEKNTNKVHNSVDKVAEILADEGISYLEGLNGNLQDIKKGIKTLEKSGKMGASKAYFILGSTFVSTKYEKLGLKKNTEKALEYFEKGTYEKGIESNLCHAEMAKIFMGAYNHEPLHNLNSKSCWERYFNKISETTISKPDIFYILYYIENVLSSHSSLLVKTEEWLNHKKVFNIISLIKEDLKKEVEGFDIRNDGEGRLIKYRNNNFVNLLLDIYFANTAATFMVTKINSLTNNTYSLEGKAIQGSLKTGDIIKLEDGNYAYFFIEEILTKSDGKESIIVRSNSYKYNQKDINQQFIKIGEVNYSSIFMDELFLESEDNQLRLASYLYKYERSNFGNENIDIIKFAAELGWSDAYDWLSSNTSDLEERIYYLVESTKCKNGNYLSSYLELAEIYELKENNVYSIEKASYYWDCYFSEATMYTIASFYIVQYLCEFLFDHHKNISYEQNIRKINYALYESFGSLHYRKYQLSDYSVNYKLEKEKIEFARQILAKIDDQSISKGNARLYDLTYMISHNEIIISGRSSSGDQLNWEKGDIIWLHSDPLLIIKENVSVNVKEDEYVKIHFENDYTDISIAEEEIGRIIEYAEDGVLFIIYGSLTLSNFPYKKQNPEPIESEGKNIKKRNENVVQKKRRNIENLKVKTIKQEEENFQIKQNDINNKFGTSIIKKIKNIKWWIIILIAGAISGVKYIMEPNNIFGVNLTKINEVGYKKPVFSESELLDSIQGVWFDEKQKMFIYVTDTSIEGIETRIVSSGQEVINYFEMFDFEGEFMVNNISTQEKTVNATGSFFGYLTDVTFKLLDGPIEMTVSFELEGKYVNYNLQKLGNVEELKSAVDNYFENEN